MEFFTVSDSTAWVAKYHANYIRGVSLNALNQQTRTYNNHNSFISHLREWDDNQKQLVKSAVTFAIENTSSETKWLCSSIPWRFIAVDDALESGMPHTIHSAIVFPAWWIRLLGDSSNTAVKRSDTFFSCIETLIHERVHVWQKVKPDLFFQLYKAWGWKRIDNPHTIPVGIVESHRHNPDTPFHWAIFEQNPEYCWIPCVKFKPQPKNLHDVDYFLVRLHVRLHIIEWHPMTSVRWYQSFYNSTPHCYHPDEASAVLIASIARYGVDTRTISNSEKALMAWMLHECS